MMIVAFIIIAVGLLVFTGLISYLLYRGLQQDTFDYDCENLWFNHDRNVLENAYRHSD